MLHRAVELRPEDGFIVDSLGWAYYRLGENDKAVTYLERAVELQPGDPVLNDHLGDVYWRVGRTREARFQWQRALTFEPESDQVPLIQKKLANGLADARTHRQALVERDRDPGCGTHSLGQAQSGAADDVAVARRQVGAERAGALDQELGVRPQGEQIADLGEHHHAVQLVIAVGAPAGQQ